MRRPEAAAPPRDPGGSAHESRGGAGSALGFPRFPPAKSAPRSPYPSSAGHHHLKLRTTTTRRTPSPATAAPIPTTTSSSIPNSQTPTEHGQSSSLLHDRLLRPSHCHPAQMDGALGAWEAVRGFFTPATLFLVLNLVIGTILLSSRNQQRRRHPAHDRDDAQQQQQPLQHHEQQHQEENQYYHDQQQQEQQQYVPPPPEPAPAPLARTSSVLDRLRSIGIYRFRSGDFPPEYTSDAPATDSMDVPVAPAPASGVAHHARSRSEPALEQEDRRRAPPSRMKKSSSSVARRAEAAPPPAARVVQAAVLEEDEDDEDDLLVEHAMADDEFTDSFTTPQPAQQQEEEEEEQYYQEEYVPPYRPAPLARAPSVLDRLRSFSLYRFRSGDLAPELDAAPAEEAHATHYSRSRSEPAREQDKKGKKPTQQAAAGAKIMSKSSSEARKAPAPEAAVAEEGGVDARADDFINSFRKQLQLQRLNSLLNYKEMLNRGA